MNAFALAALAGCSFALNRAPSPPPPPSVKIECDSRPTTMAQGSR
jgi:hypothetical protein